MSVFLKAWREDRNLSQEEIARVMGCSQSMVSRIETEEHIPSAEALENLCEHYGVRPSTLGYRLVRSMRVERLNG